ncbi:MAG: hypothetical protein KF851_10650 [Pirellulaceae bacterium]|nr:hypothetical protein [Pirellulaceae bacterium]
MLPKTKNHLVIEWDRQQARYAWVCSVGARNMIRAIGSVQAAEGESTSHLETYLADIKALLRLKNPELVFVMPRREIEEFEATLPPSKDDELAQLVLIQAHERWPGISEQSIIDYYHMVGGSDGMLRVSIAALLDDKRINYIGWAKSAGWKLSAIRLRHLASVNLLQRQVALASWPQSVLLSVSRKDADLVVFSQGQISLVRTIPLAAESTDQALAEKLKLEIQRSLLVASPPANDSESPELPIFLFGDQGELSELVQRLEPDLPGQIRVIDPFVNFQRSNTETLEDVNRYAAVLGAALEGSPATTLDFCKPKCVKKRSAIYRRIALYAAAGCLLLGALIGNAWQQVAEAREQNLELKRELAKVDEQIANLKKRTAVVDYVSQWQRDDINWLEELRGLSLRMPSRSQTQVRSMTMTSSPGRKGMISMNLRAGSDSVISEFEKAVRDGSHQVRTNQLSQTAPGTDFPWQFGAAIMINPRDRQQLAEDRLLADRYAIPPRDTIRSDSTQRDASQFEPGSDLNGTTLDSGQPPIVENELNDGREEVDDKDDHVADDNKEGSK